MPRSLVVAAMLLGMIFLFPRVVWAAEAPADTEEHAVIFGLSAKHLAIATAVGAGLGVTAAVVSGNAAVGTGLSVLAAIYLAHLAVEVVVVGGVYYFWPWASESDEKPELATAPMTSGRRVAGLQFAGRTRHTLP